MIQRVLISEPLTQTARAVFTMRGIEVDFQPNLSKDPDKLAEIITDFDGLVVGPTTKVTSKILYHATTLKVIGCAGVDAEHVDIAAATAQGIVVMNTPFASAITLAEHAIALMFTLARHIPTAILSTRTDAPEMKRFSGIEITGKTIGLIGWGNVESIIAERARGLHMSVVACDPTAQANECQTREFGVEMIDLDSLLARADFISLHLPLTMYTNNILSAANLAKTKRGVHIINCAAPGLVDQLALERYLEIGHVAGAAFDVFETDPTKNALLRHANVVCTPNLGASTKEAEDNTARQIAEQMSDYLGHGLIVNAVNFPPICFEEVTKLKPFIALAERLGSFSGQLTAAEIKKIWAIYEGAVANLNTKVLTASILAGLLRTRVPNVNMISAPTYAKKRNIEIDEVTGAARGGFESLITLIVETEGQQGSVTGTVLLNGNPRVVSINGIKTDAEFSPTMIYTSNQDKPGFIGRYASILGNANINIATITLGRDRKGGSAISLIAVDGNVSDDVLCEIKKLPEVDHVQLLDFGDSL